MKSYMKGFIPYALAAFLVGIVGGFAAVLGPAFVRDMGLSYNNTTWTALAMAMSASACAPALGKLGDALGRRRTLLLGIGIFALGNGLTAVASSLAFMLIARFTVGVGMAAISPVVIAYIVSQFPQESTGKGFSLYMIISSGAVIFGPTLGELMVASYGWRAMMWLCTALSAVIFFICLAFREENVKRSDALKSFDVKGTFWVIIFFSLLLCLPSFGQNFGWTSTPFILVLSLGIIALFALIYAEKRAQNPVLPWGFIRRRAFILSVLALFLTQGLMQANMTNTIVFVSYTQPENTLISGIAISVMYLGMTLGSLLLGPLSDRYEPKYVLIFSLLFTGIGCGMMRLFSESSSALHIALSLGVLGLGLGGNGTVLMKVVLSGLPPLAAGAGTGTYGLFRDLSAPFGVAVFVPMFTNSVTRGIESLALSPSAAAVMSMHDLAIVEMLSVIGGIVAVSLLPSIKEKKYET